MTCQKQVVTIISSPDGYSTGYSKSVAPPFPAVIPVGKTRNCQYDNHTIVKYRANNCQVPRLDPSLRGKPMSEFSRYIIQSKKPGKYNAWIKAWSI
jgi:hypothetical protein